MLEERRTEMAKLSVAVRTAKEAFIKATENLGLPEDILLQYLKVVSENTLNTNEGYKNVLCMFDVANKDETDTNSVIESKPETKGNESKTTSNDNRKPDPSDDNGNGNGIGKDSTNSNGKNGKDTSSLTQSDSAAANSKPADTDKTGMPTTDNEQNNKSDKQSDQNSEQQRNNAKQGKENGKGN
jgi:hypothetical protein